MPEIKIPKKLIEVALPLDDINAACAREKSIRHGHPSTLHLWWARRPLAAARAVIFAQMVNDPSAVLEGDGRTKEFKQRVDAERERLFQIIRELVLWENTTNEEVLNRARAEIQKSWRFTCELNKNHPQAIELFNPDKLPAFHDPFAGGGALPLEAQRLGLESYASDLNPVAVLINKAMIEIPPKFAGMPPINPEARANKTLLEKEWKGAQGLAEDVRYYGQWMRDEAEKRIGHLYPKVAVTTEMVRERPDLEPYVGQELTVIAWLWARTVKSPNPAFSRVDVPLVSNFMLSTKAGKEAYVEPIVENGSYHFTVKVGKPTDMERTKRGSKSGGSHSSFLCVLSGTPMPFEYLRGEAKARRMNSRLMAIVAEGKRGRVYLAPMMEHEAAAERAEPEWKPEVEISHWPGRTNVVEYGLTRFGDLFTPRQLVALTTFSDLVAEAIEQVHQDALQAGKPDDPTKLCEGGTSAKAYAETVGVYLGMAVSRTTNTINALAVWSQSREQSVNLFSRQAIPMAWDFPEVSPFGGAAGDFGSTTTSLAKTIAKALSSPARATQQDAQTQDLTDSKVVSTDPPYYDNVGYADLSDFFYVWLRRSLRTIFPDLFATLAVPKSEELVATPYRHGSKAKAETFFLDGMKQAMNRLVVQAHPAFPVTIYYAFKQSETETAEGTSSTGWETFLDAVIYAGFGISGTWPMRTERPTGVKTGTNALASSIVLVCQKRQSDASSISRRDFQRQLRNELPEALEVMVGGSVGRSPIAPVDLAQAAIGPGMGIYSQYKEVLNQDGSRMSVHDALILINREITNFLSPDEGSSDSATLFCSAWFEENGWNDGLFGSADTLARAKGTVVDSIAQQGVLRSGGGKVQLMRWSDYAQEFSPKSIWATCHQIVRLLKTEGESEAGQLLAQVPEKGESVRQLAYHLYTLCERKGWAADAQVYNELITSWPNIVEASYSSAPRTTQTELFDGA